MTASLLLKVPEAELSVCIDGQVSRGSVEEALVTGWSTRDGQQADVDNLVDICLDKMVFLPETIRQASLVNKRRWAGTLSLRSKDK